MTTHLAALEEAFRRDPASTETFAALDRNYRANGQEDALPKLYERHADAIGDMRQAAELCWQAAKLYDKRHKNEDELRVLRRAVSLDASVHEATDRLTQLAEEGERWSELVHLFDKAIGNLETANNPLRLAQFQFHAGRIWETRFHRLDKAIAYYQAAFKSDPTHTDAIEAGRRIYAAAGRWPIVLQLYEIEIATTHETKSRADLLLEMAEVAREKTGELETAARALTEAAQLRPGEETIIEALGEVYASPEWPAPGGLERAAQIFIQIAQRREARSDRDGTISYLRRALGADPENEGAATRLERAYRETGRWEDLDRLFRQRISVVDPQAAKDLALRRGELLDRKLGDRKGAQECYRALLDEEEPGGPAEHRLREILRADSAWDELLALDKRALEHTKAEDARIRLLMEMATIQSEQLMDPTAAAPLIHEVLQINPQHHRALAAYEDFFRQKGDFRNLAELLRFSAKEAKDNGAPPMEVCARLEELAEICEKRLGDLPEALGAWEAIAKLHHDVRRSRDEIARLTQKIEHVTDIARRLKYDITQAATPIEQREARRHMAEVYFRKNIDPLRTIEILKEVLEEAPLDENALDLLIQLYEREANDDGLAWALNQRLASNVNLPQRIAILQRLADLYAGPLDSTKDARQAYRDLAELLPQDDDVHAARVKLFEQTEDYQGLAEELERRAKIAAGADDRMAALRALGRLMDGLLAGPAQAVAAWKRVLEQDPNDEEALTALADLYKRIGQPADRLAILQRYLDRIPSSSSIARIKVLRDIAHIAGHDLDQPQFAVTANQEIASILPADRDALQALAKLYRRLNRYDDLVQILDQQIDLTDDPEDRATLAFLQVDILEEKIGDLDEAARCYEQIIREIAPGDLDGYRRLRQLHLRRSEYRRACELAETEFFLLPADTSPEDRVELALEIAKTWWDQLHEAEHATLAFERVLDLAPGHPLALAELRRLYHRVHAHDRLVNLAPQLFGTLQDDRERQVLLFEIAQVWEHAIGDPHQAFEWYRRAHDLYPQDGTALNELKRMAQEHAFWEELFIVYEETRKRTQEADAVLELTDAMTSICHEHLNDPAKAFNVLRDALTVDPNGGRLLPEIELLADEARLHDELCAVYNQILPACSIERRREILWRRAQVTEKRLGSPDRALDDVIRLLSEHDEASPRHLELLDEIDRLAILSGRGQRGLGVHFVRLGHASGTEQVQILKHIAGLLAGPLDETWRAFDAWLHALLLSPLDETSRDEAWRLAEILAEEPLSEPVPTLFTQGSGETDEIEEIGNLIEVIPPSHAPPPPPPPPRPAAQPPRPFQIASSRPGRDDDATTELTDEDAIEIFDVAPDPTSSLKSRPAATSPSPPPRPEERDTAPPPLPSRGDPHAAELLPEPPRKGDPWTRLVETFRQAAEALARADRVPLLREAARVYAEGAHDPERAFQILTEAAVLDLRNPAPREHLEALAQKEDAWPRLFSAYTDLIEQASHAETLIPLHLRLGVLRRDHGDTNAEHHFEAILALDPTHEGATVALRSSYEARDAFEALAAMLERQLEALRRHAPEEDHTPRILELANLHEYRLEHPFEAANFLSALVTQHPQDVDALDRLAALYEQVALWPQQVDTLQRLLTIVESPQDQATVYQRLGKTFEEELELPHRAIEAYRNALERDPLAVDVLVALQRLYAAHDQSDELVSILQQQIQAGGDPITLSNLGIQLSRVLETQGRLDEAADALVHLRQDGIVDPDIDERLAQILVLTGRAQEAVDLLQERSAGAKDRGNPPAEIIAILIRLARLLDVNLGRPDEARDTLREALEVDPANLDALEELVAQTLRANDLPAYADTVLQICDHLTDEETLIQRLLDAATHLREGGTQKHAIAFYDRVLQHDRNHLEAIDAVLGLVDDPLRKLDLLERKYALANDPNLQVPILLETGRIQRAQGHSSADVATTYQRAIDLAPENIDAIDALSQLLIDEGKVVRAKKLLEGAINRIAQTHEAQRMGQLYYRLGQLFEREEREDEGYRHLMEAVRLVPKDLLIRLSVGQNRFRAGRWREALRHLREALDHPDAPEHRDIAAEALYCAGVCEARLRRGDRALPFYEAAIALTPHHALALEALSSAALDRGDATRAAELLETLAALTVDRDQRVARLSVVAEISQSPEANDEDRAVRACVKIVEDLTRPDEDGDDLDPLRLELLPRTIPLLQKRERHDDVAGAAQALATLLTEPTARSDQLLIAGEALAALGEGEAADRCRREALELTPDSNEAALSLAHSLERQGQGDAVIEILHAHLEGLPKLPNPEKRATRAQIYATLARVYRDAGKTDEAINALEGQLDIQEDEAVRLTLAELYADHPHWRNASLANHRHLASNVENITSLQTLAAAATRSEPYRAYGIYATLRVINHLDDAGQAFLDTYEPPTQAAADRYEGDLTDADRRALLSAPDGGSLSNVFALLSEAIPLLLPHKLEDFGVNDDDRVSLLEKTPLPLVFSHCARTLGTKTTMLYGRRNAPPDEQQIVVAATARPAIIVPTNLGETLPLPQLRFVVGRAIELTQPAFRFAAGLEPRAFAHMLQTILRAFHPRHLRRRGPESTADGDRHEADALRRAFPYKAGRRLGELFRERPNLSFDSAAWRRAVYMSANRVGLVLSGDIASAVAQIRIDEPALADLPLIPDAIRQSPILRDLLTFATSDAYYVCRVKLGLAGY